jgi:hypothetical protein
VGDPVARRPRPERPILRRAAAVARGGGAFHRPAGRVGRAHLDASERTLEDSDELLAVWDGKPARGYGGTVDVVNAARDAGRAVTVVWPNGAVRD